MARKFPYSLTFANGSCTALSNDNIQVTDLPASAASGSYTNASITVDSAGRVTAASSGATITVFGASGGSHSTGLVPDPGSTAGTHRLLREDATWVDAVMATTMEHRLTLLTGTPVPTADQTAKTTIYMTPYVGTRISLYNGTAWQQYTSAEVSVSVPATTTTPFDVFAYDNGSGVVTIEAVTWTNTTTRATALVLQDGVLVKSGATGRRFIGTGLTTAVSGQCADSFAYRGVSNYYNRVPRYFMKNENSNTASWTYTTATYRAANGVSANKVEMVSCNADQSIEIMVSSSSANSSAASRVVGIGEDSTSVDSSQINCGTGDASGALGNSWAILNKIPTAGYHAYTWLETSAAVGTTTWYGETTNVSSGISGYVMA